MINLEMDFFRICLLSQLLNVREESTLSVPKFLNSGVAKDEHITEIFCFDLALLLEFKFFDL